MYKYRFVTKQKEVVLQGGIVIHNIKEKPKTHKEAIKEEVGTAETQEQVAEIDTKLYFDPALEYIAEINSHGICLPSICVARLQSAGVVIIIGKK